MKRRKSLRPCSIRLSTASRFSFILIFFPEMAERGASDPDDDEEDEEAALLLLLLSLDEEEEES